MEGLPAVIDVGEAGKRRGGEGEAERWSQLVGGGSESSPRSSACRRLPPAKFRRVRQQLDGEMVLRVRGEGGELDGVVSKGWGCLLK